MLELQRTIGNPVSISGIGLHTGTTCTMTFKPAPENYGIRFITADGSGFPELVADGKLYHFNGVFEIVFLHDIILMGFNGPYADVQPFRDLHIGQSFGVHPEDLGLPGSKACLAGHGIGSCR